MRRYETFVIIDPDISEEERDPVIERIKDLISKENGFLIKNDVWGMRKLAYAIKKKPRGFYLRIDFCGTGPLVDEMERFFRIDDRVMKYMTVMLDRDVDLEKIKEDLARAAEEQKQPEPQVEATDADAPPSESVEPETKTETETEAVTETEVETVTETEVETVTETEAETVTETEAETVTETEAETVTETATEEEAEVEVKAETEAEPTETEKAKEE
jgi:small subunit ribosomal protein S6